LNSFFSQFIEPIPCSIPALPLDARYIHRRPFMEKIPDGNHLEYICKNSPHRQRIICRRGKILPRNPLCYNGKNIISIHSIILFIGCRVNNETITFTKPFYRHRENVYYTCKNNNSVPLTNKTIRCINGNLSEQAICHSSKYIPNNRFI